MMLDRYQPQSSFVDVYDRGQTSFEYSVTADKPWVTVTPAAGVVKTEQRLRVGMKWASMPESMEVARITITGPNNQHVVVGVIADNSPRPARDSGGFVEGNGYVSMEAEHYTRAVNAPPVSWQRIPDFGRTLSGMTTSPADAPSQSLSPTSPRLEYQIYFRNDADRV